MRHDKQSGSSAFELILVLVWIVGICGWISNVIMLIYCSLNPLTILPILRIIGIFVPPLGAVLGFIPN